MWMEKSPSIRASRVAVAGSLYMRRASIQLFKPKPVSQFNCQTNIRNSSYGKIVKNGSRKKQSINLALQQLPQSSKKTDNYLLDKTNIIRMSLQDRRKTSTPSFGFGQIENIKIKQIEDKYKNMLNEYQVKKKAISQQLISMQNSKQSSRRLSSRFGNQSKQVLAVSSRGERQNIYRQYQKKSKQLIVQKLSPKPDVTKASKKPKITQTYQNFFKALKNQIMLQQQLRNIKRTISPQMKQTVQSILASNLDLKNTIFIDLEDDQFDPFENVKYSNLSAQALVSKIKNKNQECKKNWQENVCKLTQKQALQIFFAINFQKVQQISIKSFVRQISFLLEKHFRNRDLLSIYKKLSPLTQVNFCRILELKE